MGFGGISLAQLLILLVIVMLVFGTQRLSAIGNDLGQALKNFKKAINETNEKDNNNFDNNLSEKDK